MKTKSKLMSFAIALILMLFGCSQSYAFSDSKPNNSLNPVARVELVSTTNMNLLSPISTVVISKHPNLLLLSKEQIKILAIRNTILQLNGAECKFKIGLGCVVISSKFGQYKPGEIVATYLPTPKNGVIERSAYNQCGWCGFAGDFIAVVVFVVTAPASAPATLLLATYSIGAGFILSHA